MPVEAGSLHYALGPAVAIAVVVVLILFTRWAFSPTQHSTRPVPGQGLLQSVATMATRESALALRAVLSDAGIRSTISTRDSSHVDVLVFPDDAARARSLALGFGQISEA